uniref:Putative nucleoprotein n=1 Tax=Serpentovirinae sp. TaxID=2661817 RepID=A0A5P9KAD7_9NIDO|nr:putative nucleoprotein [Serpentovirinae sp.]
MATYYPIQLPVQQPQPTFLPPRPRRRRRVNKPKNTGPDLNKKINDLSKKLEKLLPKANTSNYYSLQASYGQDLPHLLVQPSLETDLRYRMAKDDFVKLTNDVKKRLTAGAGSITKDPTGKITVHLQFMPSGVATNSRAFVPIKHDSAETEDEV